MTQSGAPCNAAGFRDTEHPTHPASRGRPLFAPFARAAAALAGEVVRPAHGTIHFAVPKMPFISPGTP